MSRPNPPRRAVKRPLRNSVVARGANAQAAANETVVTGRAREAEKYAARHGLSELVFDWGAAEIFDDQRAKFFEEGGKLLIVSAGACAPLPPEGAHVKIIQLGGTTAPRDREFSVLVAFYGLLNLAKRSGLSFRCAWLGMDHLSITGTPSIGAPILEVELLPADFAAARYPALAPFLRDRPGETIVDAMFRLRPFFFENFDLIEIRGDGVEPKTQFPSVEGRNRKLVIYTEPEEFEGNCKDLVNVGLIFLWEHEWPPTDNYLSPAADDACTTPTSLCFRTWAPKDWDIEREINAPLPFADFVSSATDLLAKYEKLKDERWLRLAKRELARRGHVG